MSGGATLDVSIRHGEHLAPKDVGGKSDPYCLYGLVDAKGDWIGKPAKTKVQKNNLNPIWWHHNQFDVPANADSLKVECWDWDAVGSNDFMGFATVKLTDLRVSDLVTEKALELKPKGKEKVSGSIFIGYSYETADYKAKNQALRAEREKEEAALLAEHTKSASELSLDKVKSAAAAFARHAESGKITSAESLEEFLDRMQLRSEVYNALGIEKAANISEATFSKAMDDAENAKNRRDNLWRIFDANRDGSVEFKEVMQALAFFSFDLDKKKKAEFQFELFDLNGDGSLSFEEILHHSSHTLSIAANLIRSTLPSELKRNKDVRKILNEQELVAVAQKMADALDKADLGRQFTVGLFAAVGKKETDKITKEEYVTFAVEKEEDMKSVKLAVAMKLVETLAESAQAHVMSVLARKIR